MAYEWIRHLLEEREESQEQLVALLGRTPAVITNLFNGDRSLQVEEVEILANHFNVSMDFIISGKGDPLDRKRLEAIRGFSESEKAIFDHMLEATIERRAPKKTATTKSDSPIRNQPE